jgi:hypothetical protein
VAARQLAFCFSSFGTLRRDVGHRWPIFLINLIFGTTIGWIGSMIWACYSRPANSPYTTIPPTSTATWSAERPRRAAP